MKTKKIITLLEDARKAATFETAGFSYDKDLDKKVKDLTSLYRDTWIIHPLDRALALLKGEDTYENY